MSAMRRRGRLQLMSGPDLFIELATARDMQAAGIEEASKAGLIRRAILRLSAWLWGVYAKKVKAEMTRRGFGSAFLGATSKHWEEP